MYLQGVAKKYSAIDFWCFLRIVVAFYYEIVQIH